MTALTVVKAHWRLALGACLVAAAFAAGYAAHRPATIVREIQGQERVVTKEVIVEKPVTTWQERTVVVTKYRDAPTTPGQVAETTTTHETSGSRSEGTETRTLVKDDLKVKETVRVTEPPRLHAFVEAGPTLNLDTGALGVSVVAGASYRVLGPVYVGGNVIAPVLPKPLPPTLQAVVGVGL